MSLFDLLIEGNNGQRATEISKHYGATPRLNPLGTKGSAMHAKQQGAVANAGYSLNGNFSNPVLSAWMQYDDGDPNPLPRPSLLDLDGRDLPKYEDLPRK